MPYDFQSHAWCYWWSLSLLPCLLFGILTVRGVYVCDDKRGVCVCIMHGLLYTNSYGYIANVLMLQKRQYIVIEL